MSSSVLSLLSPAAFCLRSASLQTLQPNSKSLKLNNRVVSHIEQSCDDLCVCVCVYMPRGTLSFNLSSARVTFPFNDVLLSGMLLKIGYFTNYLHSEKIFSG